MADPALIKKVNDILAAYQALLVKAATWGYASAKVKTAAELLLRQVTAVIKEYATKQYGGNDTYLKKLTGIRNPLQQMREGTYQKQLSR